MSEDCKAAGIMTMWPYGFAAYPQYDDHRRVVSFWHYGKVFDTLTFGM